MSRVCTICAKGPAAGNNVSHSKRRTRRRFLPNLVNKKFGDVRVKLCTRCLRTLKKVVAADLQPAEAATSSES